jgi:hypothetical protein
MRCAMCQLDDSAVCSARSRGQLDGGVKWHQRLLRLRLPALVQPILLRFERRNDPCERREPHTPAQRVQAICRDHASSARAGDMLLQRRSGGGNRGMCRERRRV